MKTARSLTWGLAVTCLSLLLSLAYLNTLGDDSFIYRRLIENFLQSGRIEYNPGEPCYAMTSATYFFLMSALTGGFGWNIARYLISPLSHLFAAWALFGLGSRLIRRRALLVVVLAAVLFDPFYLRWFWAGWEMSFKIGAAALALWLLLIAGEKGGWKPAALAGLAMAFAVLTRPEMMFLAVLGAVYLTARRLPASMGRVAAGLAGYTGAVLAGILPWMLFARAYFGWALPHTVYAKASGVMTWTYLTSYGLRFLQILVVPAFPLYLALLVAAAVFCWKRPWKQNPSWWRNPDPRDFLLVAVWGATVAGYLVRGVYIDGIKLGMFSPFILLSVGGLLDVALRALRQDWFDGRRTFLWIAALLAISVGIQSRIYYRFSSWVPQYAQGDDARFIAFAKRIREQTPPDARIGTWELGVVGYFSERYMIDYVGLATPQIVSYLLETGNKAKAVALYHERHGGPASHIVSEIRFNPEAAPEIQEFWGYPYRLIDSERVTRIADRAKPGEYSIYALYERML